MRNRVQNGMQKKVKQKNGMQMGGRNGVQQDAKWDANGVHLGRIYLGLRE